MGDANPGGAGTRGFRLAGGAGRQFTMLDVLGASMTQAFGVSDRGQIVDACGNPNAAPPSGPTGAPIDRMHRTGWA